MKQFKVAVIGVGFIGIAHIEALRRLGNVDVVAICDPYNVKKKAELNHIEHAYTDYRVMMDELQLDFVHICTPNVSHFEIAKYALNKNIKVVLEKPITYTVEEAIELTDLASRLKLKNAVNFHNRFYPATAFMKEYISQGNIGEVISVHGMYVQDWLLNRNDYSWRLEKKQSGNTRVVADIGSHWLDLVEYITGNKIVNVFANFKVVYPKRLKAIGTVESFSTNKDAVYEEIDIDTEDIATISFEFENGAIGNCIVSQVFAGKKNKINTFISGTKASLEWDLNRHEEVIVGHRDSPNLVVKKDGLLMKEVNDLIAYPSGHAEGFPDTFKQAFNQIYNGTGNRYATFKDGLRQMVLNDCIYQSALQRKWMKVEEK